MISDQSFLLTTIMINDNAQNEDLKILKLLMTRGFYLYKGTRG